MENALVSLAVVITHLLPTVLRFLLGDHIRSVIFHESYT